jgi:hypothetical protein
MAQVAETERERVRERERERRNSFIKREVLDGAHL